MATQTPNYSLVKPAANDNYDVSVQNTNMDQIDTQLKANADGLAAKQALTNSLTAEAVLADADYIPIYDSSASAHRKTLLSSVKSFLKTYFDTLYATATHTHIATNVTDFATTVRATVITGLSVATNAAITAADTVLAALGKLQAQITANLTTFNSHKSRHATGGADLLLPSDIGASTRISGTGTLAVASWVGSAAPYSYDFAIAGLLAADTPHVDRVTGTDAAAAALINTAWGLIAGYAVKPQTSAGKITFYVSAKPTVAIPIMWEVVRT